MSEHVNKFCDILDDGDVNESENKQTISSIDKEVMLECLRDWKRAWEPVGECTDKRNRLATLDYCINLIEGNRS